MCYWWYRIEELTSDCLAQKKLTGELQTSLEMKEEQNETFKKVIASHFLWTVVRIMYSLDVILGEWNSYQLD